MADTRGEIVRLLMTSLRSNNDLNGTDLDYLVKTVAARTGLNKADAEKRVNDVITQAKSDIDKSRKAAMHTAIWLTLSLFIGAFAAAAAAWEGGGVRDETWGRTNMRGDPGAISLRGLQKRRNTMPILLWLLGIPIPLIILIMLLHH